jgi:ABC-2 type transport system permease protein
MGSLRRMIALIIKELATILKDPKSRFVVIGPPLIQFIVFGYAATFDLKDVRYALLDESHSVESRQLIAAMDGSTTFERVKTLFSPKQIDAVIDGQDARLVVHIGPQFSERIHSGRTAAVQVIVDGRDSNVAMTALGYIGTIVDGFNRQFARQHPDMLNGPMIRMQERFWFNANLRSRWFIVSALGGIISMVVVMILTSLSVAREREFGTFDQLLVAPFTPGEILIGKSVPGILLGLMDGLIFCAGAVFWFHVPFRGSIAALVLALFCFTVAIVGVGLLVSSLSATMQQALLGSFIFIMPSAILSGFTTPIANMPGWLQTAILINPLRYIVIALRQLFLEGADLAFIWPQLWPLMIIAAATLPLAAWLFRRRSQ